MIEMCVAVGKTGRSIANGMGNMLAGAQIPSTDHVQVSLKAS